MTIYDFGDPRLPERFWSKIRVDESGCWIWTASRHKAGYGWFGVGNKVLVAHRVSYAALVGPLPAGLAMQVDHLCKVKPCCNPAHLELVPARVNLARSNPHVASKDATGLCLKGHSDWRTKNGSQFCYPCEQRRKKGRHERTVAAAKAVGMTHLAFVRQYGYSMKNVDRVLAATAGDGEDVASGGVDG